MTRDPSTIVPMNPRGLMIVADDFGFSQSVSLGILDALDAGGITGTSVMTNRPGWEIQAAPLRESGRVCDLGLHLNLTSGQALTGAIARGRGAELPSPNRLFRALLRGDISRRAVEEELACQFDLFQACMGRGPDYIDGHHHVHAFPVVRDVLLEFIGARGLTDRLWIRDSSDGVLRILERRSALSHSLTLALVARKAGRKARAAGLRTNLGFSGVSDFSDRADLTAEFTRFLVAPGPRHLLMVHPGRLDPGARQDDDICLRRAKELALLTSPTWPEMLSRAGLAPLRFGDLEAG